MEAYLKNELFEGIVSKMDYLNLYYNDVIDKIGCVLISIHDPNKALHPSSKIEGFDDVLQIQFWDVEDSIGNYTVIEKSQGTEIRNFIEKNVKLNKRFLIHCAAGQSRSAGVACAVECIVNFDGDDYAYSTGSSDVKSHERYSPNLAVYDAIIKD